jgi:hypothetical protein
MLRLVDPNSPQPPSSIADEDMRNMRRFVASERHLAALEMLLLYALEEAAHLGLVQCEGHLRAARSSIRRSA